MKLLEQLERFKDIIEPDADACRILEERAAEEKGSTEVTYKFSVATVVDGITYSESVFFFNLEEAFEFAKQLVKTPALVLKAWYEFGERSIGLKVAKFTLPEESV